MAVPTGRPTVEVIDLTGDDDPPISPSHPTQSSTNTTNTVRSVNRANSTLRSGHTSRTHAYSTTEPPAKRVKLSEFQDDTYHPSSILLEYAKVTAKHATKKNPRLREGKLRKNIHTGLIRQFGSRILEDGIVSQEQRREIGEASDTLLAEFAAMPECQQSTVIRPSVRPATSSYPNENPFPFQATAPQARGLSATPSALTNWLALANGSQGGPFQLRQSPTRPPSLTSSDFIDLTGAEPKVIQSYESHNPGVRPPYRDAPPSIPASIKKARTAAIAPTSPQNFRFRAKVAAWKSDSANTSRDQGVTKTTSTYFALGHRPYVGVKSKQAILRNNGRLSKLKPNLLQKSEVFHMDFTLDEARKVQAAVREALNRPAKNSDPYKDLAKLSKKLKKSTGQFTRIANHIAPKIPARGVDDIRAFLDDIYNKQPLAKDPETQQILSVERDPYDKFGEDLRESRISSLLLAREVSGIAGFGSMRRLENFSNEFRKCLEDGLEIRSEFTNCAGDISTISWVSDQAYIAGTTVHMDSHNQQYNKPGNLVLGSISYGSAILKAYSDHRIVRPIVEKGENSTAAMRETQDPWLYTSVVSSDYDPIQDRTYTSGFDKKVKVWKVDQSGAAMSCIGTWDHDGYVNFVQVSAYRPASGDFGFVATAADVPTDAVRIYRAFKDNIAQSPFRSFSCSRILNADGTPVITDKWTYFPSTMKWGIEDRVKHYLLVGYSPRSRTGDDNDIPLDRINTGELCLWDATTGQCIQITSAKTQNVFEVLWHPSQPAFIAATSPTGMKQEDNVRTQVRIFKRTEYGTFSEIKALDCAAVDINELTIMPNSLAHCYVTAGCTDGKTYVWDTAISDKPIHVLTHGPAIEGVKAGDDEDDTGVKFTAWGTSPDRFYTGSSDGIVKVWNIRTSGIKVDKGKVILEAPAQISFGAFSPDKSKLVIGDASGRVFVLSVSNQDGKAASFASLNGPMGRVKRRMPSQLTPHPEPLPPASAPLNVNGHMRGNALVDSQQLRYSGNPTVGMVQGVNYAHAEHTFFCKEAHQDRDPSKPLKAYHETNQQVNIKRYSNPYSRTRRLKPVSWNANVTMEPNHAPWALLMKHEDNSKLDLKFESLAPEVRDVLSADGIGEKELEEGIQFLDLKEDDEAHLRGAKCKVTRDEWDPETHFMV